MNCAICGKECKNFKSLGTHISKGHPEISLKEYYDKYINEESKCPTCGNKNKFINLSKGYSKYCSNVCMNKSPDHIAAVKKGVLEKYGVENIFQVSEYKEKSKKTLLSKYGVTHSSYILDVVEKRKETYKQNYVDNEENAIKLKEKIKETTLERHGVENALQSEEIKTKYRQTCLEKYGVDNYFKYPEFIKENIKKNKEKFYNSLFSGERINSNYTPLFTLEEYIGVIGAQHYNFHCNKCNNQFDSYLDDGNLPVCPTCYPPLKKSKSEKELYDFCKLLFPDTISGCRYILKDRELDVYIPSINIAIEMNGLYWHSEVSGGKDKTYHLDKYNRCLEQNIHLITIFEDEWIHKRDIVESILLSKMNKITNRIYARNCIIREIDNSDAVEFLEQNHIQGKINGTHYGLIFDNEVVSIISVGKSRFEKRKYEILRFCNRLNTIVIGGMSRLVKHIISKNFIPLITYADCRYSTGNSYCLCGFEFSHHSSPNYFYINDKYTNRCSRMGFQKHKLSDKLLVYRESLTEWQNMQLNGYDRIWDCGNNVFEYRNV